MRLTRWWNRLGGTATEIAAKAAETSDAVQRAREEVESVESLVQVGKSYDRARSSLTYVIASEDNSCESQRQVEEISKAHHGSCQNSILLSA